MKIFLTGATGFVGAHTARALLDAGHEVRFLVRNKQLAEDYFARHGYQIDDFVVADMREKAAVKNGMQGCDAVVHAAAIVDLNAKNAEKTQSNNFEGVESVIGSACELGIKKIIYVSSMSAIFTPDAALLNEKSPLADAKDAYSKSKTMCEKRVRQYQAEGFPIIITYPSGVFGPDDPKLSESNSAFLGFLTSIVPLTSSGLQCVDARDIAIAHTLLLQKDIATDITSERYIIGGHFIPWKDFANSLEDASGLRIIKIIIPGWLFRQIGKLFDFLRHFINISFPLSKEAMMLVTQCSPADSSHLKKVVDFDYRPAAETFKDTVSWLRKAKLLNK